VNTLDASTQMRKNKNDSIHAYLGMQRLLFRFNVHHKTNTLENDLDRVLSSLYFATPQLVETYHTV
jgi:hypothetical protein